MDIKEIKDFNYLVYKRTENEIEKLAICKDYQIAVYIASSLAFHDINYTEYRLTLIHLEETSNYFCPGGGWFEGFKKSKDTGKVERYTMC